MPYEKRYQIQVRSVRGRWINPYDGPDMHVYASSEDEALVKYLGLRSATDASEAYRVREIPDLPNWVEYAKPEPQPLVAGYVRKAVG